jgi:hypothetical protein
MLLTIGAPAPLTETPAGPTAGKERIYPTPALAVSQPACGACTSPGRSAAGATARRLSQCSSSGNAVSASPNQPVQFDELLLATRLTA